MCAATGYGVTEGQAAAHIVSDFAELYGESITQGQGDAIAAVVFDSCP